MATPVGLSILYGMIGLIGWNIQLSTMPAFAIHAACLASLVAAPLENLGQNQCLRQLDSVIGNMPLVKVEFLLGIQIAFHISRRSYHGASTK